MTSVSPSGMVTHLWVPRSTAKIAGCLSQREDRDKLIPFLWQTGFPEIFAAGGFDAVIGNFPDRPLEHKEWVRQYLQRHYCSVQPGYRPVCIFRGIWSSLLRTGGALAVAWQTDGSVAKQGPRFVIS